MFFVRDVNNLNFLVLCEMLFSDSKFYKFSPFLNGRVFLMLLHGDSRQRSLFFNDLLSLIRTKQIFLRLFNGLK